MKEITNKTRNDKFNTQIHKPEEQVITEAVTKTRTLHLLIDGPLRKHSDIALKGVDLNFVIDKKGERRLA